MICLYTDKNCPYVDVENISITKKCTKCKYYGEKQKRSLSISRVARFLFLCCLVLIFGFGLVVVLSEGMFFWVLVLGVIFILLVNMTITQFFKLNNREYYVR